MASINNDIERLHEVNSTAEKISVSHVPEPATKDPPAGFEVIPEGKAKGLFPEDGSVFYNPVQEFNRDMSIANICVFEETTFAEKSESLQKKQDRVAEKGGEYTGKTKVDRGITILEGLSATGLRSMRFALEIPNVKKIVANDFSAEAVKTIAKNCDFNNLPEGLVQPNLDDCAMVCYKNRSEGLRFDVIDLDPYGSPTQFLDGAIQSVADGGLLCITATDMAVLAGNHGEAGYAKYGSMPLRAPYCHEMGLRILLQCINTHAARYKRYIEPMLSLSIDFYLRVFVRVYTSPQEVKKSASKGSQVYHCQGCHSFYLQEVGKHTISALGPKFAAGSGPVVNKKCEHCGFTFKVGGPVWNRALHNKEYVNKVIEHTKANQAKYGTFDRMLGMLTVASEELDTPFYYDIGECASAARSAGFKREMIWSAILNEGFEVSSTHCRDTGFKTNAPPEFIWAIYRKYATLPQSKSSTQHLKVGSPAFTLRQVPKQLTDAQKMQIEMKRRGGVTSEKNVESSKTDEIDCGVEVKGESTTMDDEDESVNAEGPKEFYNIDFKKHPGAFPPSINLKLKRFPMNPTANWGPKPRAKKRHADPKQKVGAKA
eukprot:CFRG1174T1